MTKGVRRGRADHIQPIVTHGSTSADGSVHDAPHREHRETPPKSSAVTWDQARACAYSAALPCPAVRVALPDALGERLARPLTALNATPAFDASAMDGFAVCGFDTQRWTIVGRLLADAADQDMDLTPGQAVEIATGAALPRGASAVLPYEHTQREANSVITVRATGRALEPRQHIRHRGEEYEAGDVLLPVRTELTAMALGLAAAAGHDTLEVMGRPCVRALVTGDELITSGLPGRGRVRDATGPQLPGLVAWAGGQLTSVRHVSDSLDALVGEFDRATEELVIVSGSSSVGPVDHLQAALRHLGAEPLVTSVACRPGHPQSLHQLPDGRLIAGLPGNPLAALVGFLTLIVPAVQGARGLPLPPLPRVRNGGITSHPTMTRLVPVQVRDGRAVPLQHGGSAMLRSVAQADALAVMKPAARPAEGVPLLALPTAHNSSS